MISRMIWVLPISFSLGFGTKALGQLQLEARCSAWHHVPIEVIDETGNTITPGGEEFVFFEIRPYLLNAGDETITAITNCRVSVTNSKDLVIYSVEMEEIDGRVMKPSYTALHTVELKHGDATALETTKIKIPKGQNAPKSIVIKYSIGSEVQRFYSCWVGELIGKAIPEVDRPESEPTSQRSHTEGGPIR
jgi:hypothetical protein